MFKLNRVRSPYTLRPLALCISLAVGGLSFTPSAVAETALVFKVDSGALDKAIADFGQQSGVMVSVSGNASLNKQTLGLKGEYTAQDGLTELLRGTGLRVIKQNGGFIIAAPSDSSSSGSTDGVQLAPLSIVAEEIAYTSNDWVYTEPRSVSVISRRQMDDRPARHAADILEQTSGVYSSLSQQDPALSVNIRGIQDFGRVNMNIDGIRQNFQKTGYGQRNGQMYIDPELLTGVTVEKGATNVMGSAGTLGGVASFNTVNARDFLTDDKTYGGKVSLGGGNNGTNFIGSGVIAAGNDQFDALLGVSRRSFADYWPGSNGSISGLRVNNDSGRYEVFDDQLRHTKVSQSAYVMESQIAKLGWNISEDERLQLSYMRTATDTGNAGALVNLGNTWPYQLGWKNPSDSEITSQNVGLDYILKPAGQSWLDLTAKLYYADTKNDTHYHGSAASWSSTVYTPAVEAYDESTRVQTYGLQAQNISQLIQGDVHRLNAVYGAELFYDTITTTVLEPPPVPPQKATVLWEVYLLTSTTIMTTG